MIPYLLNLCSSNLLRNVTEEYHHNFKIWYADTIIHVYANKVYNYRSLTHNRIYGSYNIRNKYNVSIAPMPRKY